MKTAIWAHRGASDLAPENTLEAFQIAVEHRADGVELDVQLTADRHAVVIHDEGLHRLMGLPLQVGQLSLQELQRLSFCNLHSRWSHTFVPTLNQVLDVLEEKEIQINVEMKNGVVWYEGLEEKVWKLVVSRKLTDRVVFSSFNHESLRELRCLAPMSRRALLVADVPASLCDYAKALGVEALHIPLSHTKSPRLMELYSSTALPLRVWTVDAEEDITRLDGIVQTLITNVPQQAIKLRQAC